MPLGGLRGATTPVPPMTDRLFCTRETSLTRFSLIRPTDQPRGRRRLLDELEVALKDQRFRSFRIIVAYAKARPLLHLQKHLARWSASGRTSGAILGIDQQGTSKEALEQALALFDEVYVTNQAGLTFHPKLYLFAGPEAASVFVGSNNLTVGGTETNFETTLNLEFDLPDDSDELSLFESSWNELLPDQCRATRPLDPVELAGLLTDGLVVDERTMRESVGGKAWKGRPKGPDDLTVKPARTVPDAQHQTSQVPSPPSAVVRPEDARGHAIQIKPHHNGEIFLSLRAVMQNPKFFDFPFKGRTTPKRRGNIGYPQLLPDPLVDIVVVDARGEVIFEKRDYALNTVYYKAKSELRITASPLVSVVPQYSVMLMEPSERAGIRYAITIHTPDSPAYQDWVDYCSYTMPGGGSAPRKFGWY